MLDLNNIHVIMTKTMDNAHPPKFEFEWKNDNTLLIHYSSERGLIDFAVGLTKGVGTFYNEDLKVTKLGPDTFQTVFN